MGVGSRGKRSFPFGMETDAKLPCCHQNKTLPLSRSHAHRAGSCSGLGRGRLGGRDLPEMQRSTLQRCPGPFLALLLRWALGPLGPRMLGRFGKRVITQRAPAQSREGWGSFGSPGPSRSIRRKCSWKKNRPLPHQSITRKNMYHYYYHCFLLKRMWGAAVRPVSEQRDRAIATALSPYSLLGRVQLCHGAVPSAVFILFPSRGSSLWLLTGFPNPCLLVPARRGQRKVRTGKDTGKHHGQVGPKALEHPQGEKGWNQC